LRQATYVLETYTQVRQLLAAMIAARALDSFATAR
jgi:hypothetical protein